MKTRITISILALVLLNSCIVKSLFPFFTSDTISFENKFLGVWQDSENKDDRWIITSVEDLSKIEKGKDTTPPSKEDLDFYNKYQHGYYVIYEEQKANRTSIFLAMPFKIKNQLFLDFTPLFYDEGTNNLVSYHLVPTHSLVKFDILNNNSIDIKWLSAGKIGKLIETNRIKIKHKKVGLDNNHLLTASSEELQKFITKYMDSQDENKWETDIGFKLKRTKTKEESLNLMIQVIDKKEKLSGNLFK